MKYYKHREDKELSDKIRFLDRHGKDIPTCIEYDTDTGYATVYELTDLNDPRSAVVVKQKYFPDGQMAIDNVANPDEEHLQKIRDEKK